MTPPAKFDGENRPALSVCMIVRDEERVLERCLSSLPDTDFELVVIDTGSSDRTVEIARSFDAVVGTFTGANGADGRIESFAEARNAALARATGDWVLQIDADEVLRTGHELMCDSTPSRTADALAVALRSGDALWHSIRLFRRACARGYVSPIHEYLDFSGKTEIEPRILIENLPDKTGKESAFDRNVRLLRASLESNPKNGRLWHYFGNELRAAGRYLEAADAYGKAQELETFAAGLFCSMFYRGVCWFVLKDFASAEAQARLLITRYPNRAEGYCLLADVQFCLDNFEDARRNYVEARKRPLDPAKSMMPVQTWAFGERPITQIAIIDAILGD